MTLSLALAFLDSLIAGTLLIVLSWPNSTTRGPSWLLKWSLGSGLGLALSSELYFLWLCLSGRSTGALVVADLLLLASLGGALFLKKWSSRTKVPYPAPLTDASPIPRSRTMERWLTVAVLLALIAAAVTFVSAFISHPHGGWDAWMSWNLRARFFFRAGDRWHDAFSRLFWGANPEYPVFLPAIVARLWQYSRQDTQWAPALVALLFTFATAALVYSSLRLLRSKGQGLLAVLVLLGTPFFVQHGTFQMADVPLGFFFLASIVALCIADRLFPDSAAPFLWTGWTASCAVWTKNEGLLFLAALIVAGTAVLVCRGELKMHARQGLALAGGLLLLLPLALYVKAHFAPPDIMLGWNRERLHQIVEGPRYWAILKAFGSAGLRFGRGLVPVTPLLVFYGLLLRIDFSQTKFASTAMAMGAWGLTLVGYGFVYLTTPQNLAWHLRTSLDRLLLQLWPSAIFVYFLLVRTPEQALGGWVVSAQRPVFPDRGSSGDTG